MIHTIAIMVLLFSMALVLFRSVKGDTAYDRILATNSLGSLTILVICLLAGLHKNPVFIDIALLYTLINFIASIALLRYFAHGKLHHDA